MLTIEIEFLTGVSVSKAHGTRDETEWPPHPDRLFQSLVAAWGRADPVHPDETAALEWLEALDPAGLRVQAPRAGRRQVCDFLVPPNDDGTTRSEVGAPSVKALAGRLRVIPEYRRNRQPRTFPAAVPVGSNLVVYTWETDEGEAEHRPALARLAREVAYIGHSHTPVRAWVPDEPSPLAFGDEWIGARNSDLRIPYRGRLKGLEEAYRRGDRPATSTALHRMTPAAPAVPRTDFADGEFVVLADAGGCQAPALEAFPLVAKRLRDALIRTAHNSGLLVSELLSGHDSHGEPSRIPHIAFVPMADVGWANSVGRIMGVGLIWPRSCLPEARRADMRIVAAFIKTGGELRLGRAGTWRLSLDANPRLASLSTARYAILSRRWSTVLPLALDRHPKSGLSVASIVKLSCSNQGIPADVVNRLTVEFSPEPTVRGAPHTRVVCRTLAPDSPYRNRRLGHATLEFPTCVWGPLLVGAGRFRGLGFCLPLVR